jgi:hypothetical protein
MGDLPRGGYRGHRHAILEPWTGLPMQLQDAIEAGAARCLNPGETLETEVAFLVYSGVDHVESIAKSADSFLVK